MIDNLCGGEYIIVIDVGWCMIIIKYFVVKWEYLMFFGWYNKCIFFYMWIYWEFLSVFLISLIYVY